MLHLVGQVIRAAVGERIDMALVYLRRGLDALVVRLGDEVRQVRPGRLIRERDGISSRRENRKRLSPGVSKVLSPVRRISAFLCLVPRRGRDGVIPESKEYWP